MIRMLYAAPALLALGISAGDIFDGDQLAPHGIDPKELLARGDAEETDAPATRTIAPPPVPEIEAAAEMVTDPVAEAAAKEAAAKEAADKAAAEAAAKKDKPAA